MTTLGDINFVDGIILATKLTIVLLKKALRMAFKNYKNGVN